MNFKIVGKIAFIQVIASGSGIRTLTRLRKNYGPGRSRKMKGITVVQFQSGQERKVELHWYEAHGIGKKEFKIKRFLEEEAQDWI